MNFITMSKDRMSKTIKFVLFAVLGIILLVVVAPLVGGIFLSVNPNKAVQMAQQKTAESKEVYIPQGFTISKKSEPKESSYGTLYVTEMLNGDKKIQIIQSSDDKTPCKGEAKNIGGKEVCYFGTGKLPNKPTSRLIMWHTDKNYQLETDADSKILSEDELAKIVSSL